MWAELAGIAFFLALVGLAAGANYLVEYVKKGRKP